MALALTDLRTDNDKKQQERGNVQLIEGDILAKSSWVRLQEWLDSQDVQGFDFIIARPVGGFDTLPRHPMAYHQLLNRAWKLLNRDGGTIYTQIPTCIGNYMSSKMQLLSYIDTLNSQDGISTDVSFNIVEKHYGELRLTRYPEGPASI